MAIMPGGFQNFAKSYNGSILSQDTINQNQFPYHTFVVIDTKQWAVVRQHTLIINPQELSKQEPVRANVVQTLGGAYVDDFGRGLPRVNISGHTGWRLKPMPDGSAMQDGWQAFKALRNDVFRYFTDVKDDVRTYLRNPNYIMRWYHWSQDEYYNIQPLEFDLQQSVSNPLFYQYTINFICLQDITKAVASGGGAVWKLGAAGANATTAAAINIDTSNLGALASAMR